ncbi:MAG: SDR family oxidoreductase [Sulfitobacter sp.]|uniref:SDR family NAD(P)-dependent oxidoreductase n=1 Tax=Alphaproteobacteria TaxID=28211 RepID=UPI0032671480
MVKQTFGRLAILVNNAAVADFGLLAEAHFSRWPRAMNTNIDCVFLMSQACLALFSTRGGAIVNIALNSGLRASTLRIAYGTFKVAVIHLTKQQGAELGEVGIRANYAGPVDTKLTLAVDSSERRAAYHDAMPLTRYGSKRKIAHVFCFLVSDRASYVTR